jgi:hypothetical protein
MEKGRFRAPRPAWFQNAHLAPNRGIVWGDYRGSYQPPAWNVSSGKLQQLTSRPNGVGYTFGTLNPEGTFVYYHEDDGVNEIGHFVRIPYERGAATDVTPKLPPCASLTGMQESRDESLQSRVRFQQAWARTNSPSTSRDYRLEWGKCVVLPLTWKPAATRENFRLGHAAVANAVRKCPSIRSHPEA